MLKILGRSTSINVRKVLWTADELGLSYEHQPEWGSERALREPEFRRLNPNGLVPVVLVDGEAFWESNAICRFLAAREQRTDLLPAQPRSRFLIEKWMDWQATTLTTAAQYPFMGLVRSAIECQEADEIERGIKRWNRAILLVEAALAERSSFLAADYFSLADIVIGLALHRWRISPINHVEAPQIASYMERLSQRPLARRWFAAEFSAPAPSKPIK